MKLLIPGLIMYNLNNNTLKHSEKKGSFDHQMMVTYVKMVTHNVPKDAAISIPFAALVLFGLSFTLAGTVELLESNKKDNN